MGIALNGRNASGGTTDHSADIEAMRDACQRVMQTYPDIQDCPEHLRREATILMAAAALLEVHDASGISLDDWTGPLELVYEALWLIGKDRPDFIPNGV